MKLFRYTVIEMIAVISIGAVLMAVSVPAFSHLLRGNAPGMAARELMGKLASARSYAAANRTYVAVVFPQNEDSVENNFKYTTYRICKVSKSGSSYSFQEWLGNWNRLPQGIVITTLFNTPSAYDAGTPEKEGIKNTSGSTTAQTVTGCVVNDMTGDSGTGSTTNLTNCIIFNSRGLPDNGAVRIPIQMGTVDNGTASAEKSYLITGQNQDSSKFERYYCVPLVIRATGKVKFFDTLVAP